MASNKDTLGRGPRGAGASIYEVDFFEQPFRDTELLALGSMDLPAGARRQEPASIRLTDIPSIATTASMTAPAKDGRCGQCPTSNGYCQSASPVCLASTKETREASAGCRCHPPGKSLPFATGCGRPTGRVAIPSLQTPGDHRDEGAEGLLASNSSHGSAHAASPLSFRPRHSGFRRPRPVGP
jgi:hypothetical protein